MITYAQMAHDGEKVFFTLRSNPNLHLSVPRESGLAVGGGESDAWLTAKLLDDNKYLFYVETRTQQAQTQRLAESGLFSTVALGYASLLKHDQVLDEKVDGSSIVYAYNKHGRSNQQWGLCRVKGNECRIKNVETGHYLTYNPPDNQIYGFRFCDENEENGKYQIWVKH